MGKGGEQPDLSPDRRCTTVLATATPWLLLIVGTVLLFLGIYYREFADADTPNGALIAVGCAMILAAFSLSCVTVMPKRETPPSPPRETQLLPSVSVAL